MEAGEIRGLDAVAARAMPADEVAELDGWLLRSSRLPAGRVNSVWPLDPGVRPLPARIAEVERHYAGLGRPALYQVSPAALPSGLEQALDARGYAVRSPVLVQTLALHAQAEDGAAARGRPDGGSPVRLAAEADASWLRVWGAASGRGTEAAAAAARMFDRVRVPSAFATLVTDGRPVAVGRGVADGGWLGIFAMATLPPARRRGAAQAVLAALLRWGRVCGAHHAYLQCAEDNASARSLYGRAGFATAYAYHYRRAAPILFER